MLNRNAVDCHLPPLDFDKMEDVLKSVMTQNGMPAMIPSDCLFFQNKANKVLMSILYP